MVKLTIKQKVVLEAIEWYIKEYGISPTVREIAKLTNTTSHPTHEKLLKLEELGVISTINGSARSIRVLIPLEEIENDEY
jgi:SOS-response transcriptional repressor LexA